MTAQVAVAPWRWPSDRVVLPATLAVAVGAVVLRRPEALSRPALWAEDGHVWFADAYEHGPMRPLLAPHTGYLQTFPRLVADLGLLLPVRSVPLLFAVVAIVVQALPAVVLVSRRFESLVPRPAARLAFAAAYLAVPNAGEVDANLTNAQWHLAVLALVCLLAAPAGRWWRSFDLAVTVLSGLTGPFVIALAVVGLPWLRHGRRDRWTSVLWGVSAVLACVQVAELLSHRRPIAHLAPLGATAGRFLAIVGGQIGLGGLLGSHWRTVLGGGAAPQGEAVGLVVVVVLVGAVLLAGPAALRVVVVYAGGLLAAALLSPMASTSAPQWAVLAATENSRYWLVPILALLASTLWATGWAWALIGHHRWRTGSAVSLRRLRVGAGMVGVTAAALTVVVAMPGSWRLPNWPRVGEAHALAVFARARPGQVVVVPTDPPGWHMVLRKR